MRLLCGLLLLPFLMVLSNISSAAEFVPFTVKDIRVEGLQRIEVGTVFNYLPIRIGDAVDEVRSSDAVRALYKTGFFVAIQLARDGEVLIVTVEERPFISGIKLSGNKDISSDDLKAALKKIGLDENHIFDRSLLDLVERELERQYFARGKYGVKISSEVKELPRNRVDIELKIAEGEAAKIRKITLVGNHAYDTERLLRVFNLTTPTLASFFTQNDQYSKQKLSADLESLRSFYLDRGHIDFNIESTQVSITPDKKDVYITVNISEGEKYSVREVKLAGDLVVPEEELRSLISIRKGELFSRKQSVESATRINERLGKEGYAFANINPIPEVDRDMREVMLTFAVDPGKRVYVNRINMAGNTRTRDEVMRREVRQMEGAWLSTDQVNRSRVRLQRLGYFDEVNVETPQVPGTDDQVDVNFSVKERSSFGSLMAGVGYQQSQGVLLNASVTQENFFGTGKRVSAAINNSRVNTVYSFSYTNPYYTMDGISRGFKLFSRSTDAGNANVGDFVSDVFGGNVNYGIPLSEYDTFRVSFGIEHTNLKTYASTPQAYLDFIANNERTFDALKTTLGWSHDTRNRAFFPDEGFLQSLSSEIALPGSGVNYYKITSSTAWYRRLSSQFTLSLSGDVAFGSSYGETTDFPFFEHYYAGGIQSVRGYRSNSLGPQENGRVLGGAFRTVGSAEVIFPPPFAEENNSFRLGVFFDIGNVFSGVEQFDAEELRYAAGMSAVWLSPIGPLTFSLARALNAKSNDDTEGFQFSLGALF